MISDEVVRTAQEVRASLYDTEAPADFVKEAIAADAELAQWLAEHPAHFDTLQREALIEAVCTKLDLGAHWPAYRDSAEVKEAFFRRYRQLATAAGLKIHGDKYL